MKKLIKITTITIGAIILLLLILPYAFKGTIENIVRTEASAMLNAKLEFRSLGLGFLRHFPNASVELNDFAIIGNDEFAQDTLVRGRRIEIVVGTFSIFSSSGFEISHIGLKKIDLKALKRADGKVNWDIMKSSDDPTQETTPADTTSASTSAFALRLSDMSLSDCSVMFIDDSSNMSFYTDNLNLKLKGDMSANSGSIDCRIDTHNLCFMAEGTSYIKEAEIKGKLTINADFQKKHFAFDENSLSLNAIAMNLDGWVAMTDNGIDMDIKASCPNMLITDLLSLIPQVYKNDFDALKASGALSMEASAKGLLSGENLPAFDLTLSLDNGTLGHRSISESINDIDILAKVNNKGGSVDNTVINLEKFNMSIDGTPFKATMKASTPISNLNFKMSAHGGLNLSTISKIVPLGDNTSLSGVLTAGVDIAGTMKDIEQSRYENISAKGNFSLKDMVYKSSDLPEISIGNAVATINTNKMALKELAINIGSSDITASGEVSNYLGFVMKGKTLNGELNVSSRLMDLNEIMANLSTEEPQPSTSEQDTEPSTMSVVKVPENLNLSLNANFDKVIFQKMNIEKIKGSIVVANGIVKLSPLSMNMFNGTVKAKGSYSTAQATPQAAFSFDFANASFEQTFNQLDMIKQIVPIFAKTGGNYSMSLDMTTDLTETMEPDLNSLKANGVISSKNIKVQNITVFDKLATVLNNDKFRNIEAKDVEIPFSISDGKITTKPFNLNIGNIGVNLSGTTSLNQQIDYSAKIELPEGSRMSTVYANIGGTFTSPNISLDTKATLKEALTSSLTNKLTSKLGGSSTTSSQATSAQNSPEQIRAKAKEAGDKLVATAQQEGQKLVDKASNPLAKIAAKKAAEALVNTAQKQADKLMAEAEAQIAAQQ